MVPRAIPLYAVLIYSSYALVLDRFIPQVVDLVQLPIALKESPQLQEWYCYDPYKTLLDYYFYQDNRDCSTIAISNIFVGVKISNYTQTCNRRMVNDYKGDVFPETCNGEEGCTFTTAMVTNCIPLYFPPGAYRVPNDGIVSAYTIKTLVSILAPSYFDTSCPVIACQHMTFLPTSATCEAQCAAIKTIYLPQGDKTGLTDPALNMDPLMLDFVDRIDLILGIDLGPCSHTASRCLYHFANASFTGRCMPGYGNTFPCSDILLGCTEFHSNVCSSVGVCVNNMTTTPITTSCICNTGFNGTRCENNIDDCVEMDADCGYGTCIDKVNTYSCKCDPGYEGAACTKPTDECIAIDCGFGTCKDLFLDYTCVCLNGWDFEEDGQPCDVQVPCTSTSEFFSGTEFQCLPCDTSCLTCTEKSPEACTSCKDTFALENSAPAKCIRIEDSSDLTDCGTNCGVYLGDNSWGAFFGLLAAYLVVGAVYFMCRHVNKDADNYAVIGFGVCVINTLTDVIFAVVMSTRPEWHDYFVVCLVVILFNSFINLGIAGYFFATHIHDTQVGEWVENHHSIMTVSILLSAISIQALRFSGSNLMNSSYLKLEWPNYVLLRIKIISITSLFLQDLPQICIQLLFFSNSQGPIDLIPLMAFLASAISFIYGISSRMVLCLTIVQKGRRVDMHAATSTLRGTTINSLYAGTSVFEGVSTAPSGTTLVRPQPALLTAAVPMHTFTNESLIDTSMSKAGPSLQEEDFPEAPPGYESTTTTAGPSTVPTPVTYTDMDIEPRVRSATFLLARALRGGDVA